MKRLMAHLNVHSALIEGDVPMYLHHEPSVFSGTLGPDSYIRVFHEGYGAE